ncbi:MAG: ankyrin repeat domain-containing protein [Elusimicrobiales bacterium]
MTRTRATAAKPELIACIAVLAAMPCAPVRAAGGAGRELRSLARAGNEAAPPPAQMAEAQDPVINAFIPKSSNLQLDKMLLSAAGNGNLGKVRDLISKGANADFADGRGSTPLLKAAALAVQLGMTAQEVSPPGVKRGNNRDPIRCLIEEKLAGETAKSPLMRDGSESLMDQMNKVLAERLKADREKVLSVIKELIAHGADAARANDDGIAPLHYCAAAYGMEEAVRLLIDNGADTAARDNDGDDPLIYAAMGGNARNVELFIGLGANIKRADRKGITPLLASLSGKGGGAAATALLLKRGANINDRDKEGQGAALFAAATNKTAERLALALDKGADPNAASKNGLTPMMAALQRGKADFVKLLQARGGKSNSSRDGKKTPLMCAAAGGNINLIESLLAAGADINEADKEGNTALLEALKRGRHDVAAALIQKGADVSARTTTGTTALMTAASRTESGTLQLLLDKGQDVNAVSDKGVTALMMAAQAGNGAAAQFLLSKGANPAAKDAMGKTAMVYAMANDAFDIADMIKDALDGGKKPAKTSTEGQQ